MPDSCESGIFILSFPHLLISASPTAPYQHTDKLVICRINGAILEQCPHPSASSGMCQPFRLPTGTRLSKIIR